MASFLVHISCSLRHRKVGDRKARRESSPLMDKPRPGQGIGAADVTVPDGDCWGTVQNYRRSAAAAGKNPHVQDVNFVRNLASSDIFVFFFFPTEPLPTSFFPLVFMMTN